MRVLAVDPGRPGVVYAEADGLFRSEDGGDSWSRLPLEVSGVAALAVLPGSGALLAASGKKLYKSPDGGALWTLLLVELVGRSGVPRDLEEFIVSGSEIGTVYLLAEGGDLFRSDDEGATWASVPIVLSGHPGTAASSLAIDPATPSTLYAGLIMGGAARSLDRGAHWEPVNTGFDASPFGVTVWSVAVDPNAHSTIYAGLDGGAYRSLDGGAHWTRTGDLGPRSSVRRIAVSPVTSAVLAHDRGTTFRSTDRGESWSALRVIPANGCASPGVWPLVLAGDGTTVYAGTVEGGALRSDDEGASWRSLGVLATTPGGVVSLDPTGSEALFLAGLADLFRSTDGGATWRAATAGAAASECASFRLVAAGPRGSGTVYGIRGELSAPTGQPGGPFFRSSDGGSTWATVGSERFIDPGALAVSPLDPRDLYLSIEGDHNTYLSIEGDRKASVRPALTASVAPYDRGLFRSRDGGITFTPEGIPALGARPIGIVAFDPRDPTTVWAGGDFLYRKRGNDAWSKTSLPARAFRGGSDFGLVTGIAFDPRIGAIYVAVGGAGVFRSLDDGASWADASGNLPTDHLPWEETRLLPAATGLAVEPSTGRLFLSASTIDQNWGSGSVVLVPGGVYESTDGGTTWSSLSEGLPATGVNQMLLDTRGTPTIFAATTSDLFARDVSAPLRLDSISPSGGSTAGGTLVLLSGDGFRPGSLVTVGGAPVTDFTFFSPQVIRLRTGAHASGRADVTVTNPDGARATLPGAFLYVSWSCAPDSRTLCLENGRFRVSVQGPAGAASVSPLTLKSGYFWFDWNQNPQVVVKILDGRIENGHYWIHVSALTDAAFTVRVTDTESAASREYVNPVGDLLSTIDRVSF